MSRIKLDLSKFKHIKSDKNSTTLQHKDGHILTMAHNGLSPESRDQLSAMAEDCRPGYAPGTEDVQPVGSHGSNPKPPIPEPPKKKNPPSDPDAAWQLRADQQKRDADLNQYPVYHAEGGKVKPSGTNEEYHRGGQNTPIGKMQRKDSLKDYKKSDGPKLQGLAEGGQPQGPCLNPNCKSHGKPHPNCRCYSAMAEGGQVDHVCKMKAKHYPDCELYADGGSIQQPNKNPPSDSSNDWQKQADHSQTDISQRKAIYADGTDEVKKEDRDEPHMYMKDDPPESEEDQNKGIDQEVEAADSIGQQPQAAAPIDNSQPQDQGIASQQAQAPQDQPQQETPVKPNAPPAYNPGSIDPRAQMGAGENSSNPVERLMAHKQNIQQGLTADDQAWAQDLASGHIKPLTYQSLFSHNQDGSEKSTLGKIGTIFGMIMSGAGSGLSHQPNAMLARMQQTIDNDLKAQQESKQNAVNYLKLAQQHEMNRADINQTQAETDLKTNTLARLYTTRAALHDLQTKVNSYPPGSKERQIGEQTLAMMNQYVQNDNNDLIDRAATASAALRMNNSGGGNSPAGDNDQAFQDQNQALQMSGQGDLAKYRADRHIPGVPGAASNPLTDQDRKKYIAQKVLDDKVNDVMKFAKQHAGSLDPRVIAQGKQKAEELTSFYNSSLDSLGMTEGRLNWLEDQIKKNPTSIITQIMGNNARLGEIRDSNKKRQNMQLKALGFPIKDAQPAATPAKQAPPQTQEGATGTHNGKPTVFKSGKWEYKK